MTIEALMRDGKALQAGTSHYLGQNFAKAYGVQFQTRTGGLEYAYATSWGVSTRLVGGLIMQHGDDRGLRLPPALAPHQVVVVPIFRSEDERSRVLEATAKITADLEGLRVKVDDREEHRPGFKFNEWELRGVPVRIEVGPRDLEQEQVVVARRDNGDKGPMPLTSLGDHVRGLMAEIQAELRRQAGAFTDEHTIRPDSYEEMRSFLLASGGFAVAPWCGGADCEAKVKADTKATIRYLPVDPIKPEGPCIVDGREAVDEATWARAY